MPYPRSANNRNVFVNCPFDVDYLPLFRAMVFVIEVCGFRTRCALEVDDSGETRSEKILRIILDSRYGIHDISRTESNTEGLPRFNMPYELGLFVGIKASGLSRQANKAILILDREKYRYQKYLSDIAGQDIRSHRGTTNGLIGEVRAWLASKTSRVLAGTDHLQTLFAQFQSELPAILSATNRSEKDLDNYHDFHRIVCMWIEAQVVL